MSVISRTATLPDSSNKADFYALVDSATAGSIVNADIDAAAAIADSKLAQITTASKVSGAALTSLASIPAGGGIVPAANGGAGASSGVLKANGSGVVSAATAGTDYMKPGVATAAGDIYTVAWTDYGATSTVNGWAATPTKNIYYKQIGKTVFVSFYITGTSNATTVNFTLPITSANSNGIAWGGILTYAVDNNIEVLTACKCSLAANSATVNCYTNMGTGAWTNTNAKTVYGNFWYEAA